MASIKNLFLLAILLMPNVVHAQAARIRRTEEIKNWFVFFNPLNALEPDVPIAVTFQHRFKKQYSVALDVGMFVASNHLFLYSGNAPAGGFRLKPEFKMYFNRRFDLTSSSYISFQGLIKHVTLPETRNVGRQCANGQCAYFQKVDYTEVKNVYGGNIIIGNESYLGKYHRFYIGVYLGFGLRFRTRYDSGLPPDVAPTDFNSASGFGLSITRNGWYPSFPSGINIGWRIK